MSAQDANVWRRVEVDVVEVGCRDGVVVGSLDVTGFEDPTVSPWAQADQDPVRVIVHGDFAAPAALIQLQPNDAAAKVDALPREPQQLAAAKPSVQCHGHGGTQQVELAPIRLDRALPRFGGQIAAGRLPQRDAGALSFLGLDIARESPQCSTAHEQRVCR
jgi:hypothetical protein